jgi:hypothetical protein
MFFASFLMTTSIAHAAPFTNGNFELPGLGVGATFLDITNVATAPTGWTPAGTLGNAALFYENNAFGVVCVAGPNCVGFGGNGTTGATLSQTFDTVAGQSYTVNYFVTPQQGAGPQSALVEALNGATVLGSVTETIPLLVAGQSFNWEVAGPSLTFIATGSLSTLRFTDTSNGAAAINTNWALDGVTVNAPSVAVPEPETYAMLLAGLGLLGFVAGRRKPKAA